MSAESLAAQAAVITCLAGLAVGHPNLPAAYFTISRHGPRELSVQLDSPSKVEAWREALGVDAALVSVDRLGERASLEFNATAYGVDFHVYAAYEQATVEAGAA
ncbi:hypothetical protein [Streptomyces sp. AC555_RSS877]|uniref:hypothetical protein n=1 Tax=Streptomyces sp. AC555_RSS877 TaxID=2823688 RepID=UPI001C27D446|nr:hypothetical protein [Streptomyces sp. AC555_RSS877]